MGRFNITRKNLYLVRKHLFLVLTFHIYPLCLVFGQSELPQGLADSLEGLTQGDHKKAETQEDFGKLLGSNIFYDARQFGFDTGLNKYIFRGDVVLVAGGALIAADSIEVNNVTKTLDVKGNVVFMAKKDVFTGETLQYQIVTGDFQITKGIMVTNDGKKAAAIKNQILGFTPQEDDFDSAKNQLLLKLAQEKAEIKANYHKRASQGEKPSLEESGRYALILQQEDLAKRQQNPALAGMSASTRESYERRRQFWQSSQANTLKTDYLKQSYFRLEGSVISRTNGNDFNAQKALWTPCRCEDDETPAWGFESYDIKAQMGGYVTLQHPVFVIKGLPILYLPYLKIPIKGKRQSGFLVPNLRTGSRKMGSVYTQPVFFAMDDDLDATLTTDFFQRKGLRLGLEVRYQAKQYSGWEVSYESIRDKEWLERRSLRKSSLPAAIEQCQQIPSKASREQCEDQAKLNLAEPANTWRGMQKWNGLTFLTPRLSLVGRGSLVSDHRYSEDLDLPKDIQEALFSTYLPRRFVTSKAFLHWDKEDFYLGIGTKYGDDLFSNSQFEGYQVPAHLKIRSRYLELLSSQTSPFSIFGDMLAEHYQIEENSGNTSSQAGPLSLGQGGWTRFKIEQISPISSSGIMNIHQFSNFEFRHLEHRSLRDKNSRIHSWMTGISMSLPLDGIGRLPNFFQDDPNTEQNRYLHHEMNWKLVFSTRPTVVRKGPYGESLDENGAELVYFGSDRKLYTNESSIEREQTMVPHQMIKFATSHTWTSFLQSWQRLPGAGSGLEKKYSSFHDQAEAELGQLLDPRIKWPNSMYNSKTKKWNINRYKKIKSNYQKPLWLDASFSYDFLVEKLRQEKIKKNGSPEELRDLESWQGPDLNLGIAYAGYLFTLNSEYNTYSKAIEEMLFTLALPTWRFFSLSFGHTIGKNPVFEDTTGEQNFSLTKVSSITMDWVLTNFWQFHSFFAEKKVEGEPKALNETRFGISYKNPSECWGISFLRSKEFTSDEREADYFIQLSVIFFGQQRPLDISPALQKEFGDGE